MKAALAETSFLPKAPHPDWQLRAWVQLKFGDVTVQRGGVVTEEMLAGAFNADRLVSGGYVRYMPPSTPKPPPLPPIVAKPVPSSDPVVEAARAIRRYMADHKCSWAEAEDHVDLTRAFKAIADMPRMVKAAGFGSAGTLVKSGIGSNRRATDGAREILQAAKVDPP